MSRTAIFGYRLRFSPEIQPIKQTVIDHLILKNLCESKAEDGESVGKVNHIELNGQHLIALTLDETKAALQRLQKKNFIECMTVKKKERWKVTITGQERIKADEQVATGIIQRVTEELFPQESDNEIYSDAFIHCLSIAFDRLTQNYVESTFTDQRSRPITPKMLDPIITETLNRHKGVNKNNFASAVRRFFVESNPDFDWLKWTFCKNYYSVRAIGLGSQSDFLSKSIFADACFYLDTNTLISALDETSRHYYALHQTINGFKRINCKIAILRPTVNELRDYALNQLKDLDKTLKQIPNDLLSKVSGIAARAEARYRADHTAPAPSEILGQLVDSEALITEKLGLEVIDNEWFYEAEKLPEIQSLAEALKRHYDQSPPHFRRKTESAAFHDALSLGWCARESAKCSTSYFITLDASLPTFRPFGKLLPKNKAFALYSIVPWLGSISETEDEVPLAYSALLSAQLVTMGSKLTLAEFRMLAELEMDCSKLPSEDVEQCVVYLRREARNVDLSRAEDREKIHHMVKSFFASPERKYLAEMSSLKADLEAKEEEIQQIQREREKEKEDNQSKLLAEKEIGLRLRATYRLSLSMLIFIFLILFSLWLTIQYGAGDNFMQKLGNMWWLFGLSSLVSLITARFLCKGEIWPYVKEKFWIFGQ